MNNISVIAGIMIGVFGQCTPARHNLLTSLFSNNIVECDDGTVLSRSGFVYEPGEIEPPIIEDLLWQPAPTAVEKDSTE